MMIILIISFMAVSFGDVASAGLGLLGLGNSLFNQSQQQANFEEQMRFAKYQYEDSKKYNSMPAQVARMRAAGINPALAIGSGQLGSVSSPVSEPSAPTPVSLGVGDIMNGMSSLRSSDSLIRQQDADAVGKEIDNSSKGALNTLKILEGVERVKNLSYINKKEKFLADKIEDTWLADYNNKVFDTSFKSAQARNQESQANLNEELLNQAKFKTDKQSILFNKEIAELDSRIFSNYVMARSSGLSAQAAMQSANTSLWNFFTGFDGMYLPESTRKEFIDQKLRLLESQVDMFKPEKWANIIGSLGGGLLTGFGLGRFAKGFKSAKKIVGFHK